MNNEKKKSNNRKQDESKAAFIYFIWAACKNGVVEALFRIFYVLCWDIYIYIRLHVKRCVYLLPRACLLASVIVNTPPPFHPTDMCPGQVKAVPPPPDTPYVFSGLPPLRVCRYL